MSVKSNLIIVSVFSLMIAPTGRAQSPFLFDTIVVSNSHYEVLPQTTKHICKQALGLQKGLLRVYAHIKSGEYEYYAVWDESLNNDEYYEGSILEIHGDACKDMDLDCVLSLRPPRTGYKGVSSTVRLRDDAETFEGYPPNRHVVFMSIGEENLFRQFVRDAIQRDVKAHGGDKSFRSQACIHSVLLQADYPIVLQELKAYCASSPTGAK